MSTLMITVGLPGCGKDYYYKTHFKDNEIRHISSDKIREEVFGDINDQTHNSEVFSIMEKEVIEAIKMGVDIYYNATNLSGRRREHLINIAKKFGVEKVIILLFVPPYQTCFERNKNRDRIVPQYAMDRMLKQFEPPHKSEGWDEIKIIGADGNKEALEDLLSYSIDISHNNHHHKSTIGEHMISVYNCAVINNPDDAEIVRAARYHDIGKCYCKTFTNYKGEKTEEAHYYNHANVGAYIYLSHCITTPTDMVWPEDLNIAYLIFLHMKFFEGEKSLKKVKQKYGEELFEKLYKLHKCDLMMH